MLAATGANSFQQLLSRAYAKSLSVKQQSSKTIFLDVFHVDRLQALRPRLNSANHLSAILIEEYLWTFNNRSLIYFGATLPKKNFFIIAPNSVFSIVKK